MAWGGDIKDAVHEVFDKNFPVTDGEVSIPVYKISKYDALRLVVTPAGGNPPRSPTFPKYEAEEALVTDCEVREGEDGKYASGGSYVGGFTKPDSAIEFKPMVDREGAYILTVRYAAGVGGTTHNVRVNGGDTRTIAYPGTGGGGNLALDFATVRVALSEGENSIVLTKGQGSADVDFIDLRPAINTNFRVSSNLQYYHCECYQCEIEDGGIDVPPYNADGPAQGPYRIPGLDDESSPATVTSQDVPTSSKVDASQPIPTSTPAPRPPAPQPEPEPEPEESEPARELPKPAPAPTPVAPAGYTPAPAPRPADTDPKPAPEP